MAKYQYKPLRYLIDQSYGGVYLKHEPLEVEGFAVRLPEPFHRFRVCAREDWFYGWAIDHYDTGFALMALNDFTADTRNQVVDELIRRLNDPEKRAKGVASMRKHGFGWISDEAGL